MGENFHCEFCNEFQARSENCFETIYSGKLQNRVIYEDQFFKVLPTIGQLFDNSLLLIPTAHIETLSDLSKAQIDHFSTLFKRVKTQLSGFGHVVAFEHGAHCDTGGGCGIYHAHLHIVPLPKKIDMFTFFKHGYIRNDSISQALNNLKGEKEYLLAVNEDNEIGTLELEGISSEYPSQFFRRRLAEYFDLKNSWDWRNYTFPEPRLINVVKNNAVANLLW